MPGAAALGTARRRGRMHEELADELPLFREDLNPVRAALADMTRAPSTEKWMQCSAGANSC